MSELNKQLRLAFRSDPNIYSWECDKTGCIFFARKRADGISLIALVIPLENSYLVKSIPEGIDIKEIKYLKDVIPVHGKVRSFTLLDQVLIYLAYLIYWTN